MISNKNQVEYVDIGVNTMKKKNLDVRSTVIFKEVLRPELNDL